MDDHELLREYVERQSEKAFAELVARHINMVYSTAARVVQDPGLANDVTQAVFILLARKAGTIFNGRALPGWLYRVARRQAANAVRDARIRREREMEAISMKSPEEESAATWDAIRPDLDEAMSTLGATDQNAVVLRFFEGRSWREVAGALALNEDAAQKRVSRALDKLRNHFHRRGRIFSVALVGSAIAANAVHAAPAGLVTTVTATAYAAGAKSVSLLTMIQTLLMKKTTYAVLAAALTATITIPIVTSRASNPTDAAVTAADLQQGLVLHYTFDSAPADGKVTDASGSGNDGTLTGAQWQNDPQRGGVLKFAPPGQFIRVANNASLNPSNLTLAAWINTRNQGDTWRRVFDKSFTNGYALSIGGGHTPNNTFQGKAAIEIGMAINNNRGFASSDRTVTDGGWHQVVVTYNGTEQVLYVDGVRQRRVARWTGRVPANAHDLTIGMNLVDPNAEYGEVGASFDGLIDEPMIYNRALSAKEISFLFDSQKK